MVLFVKSAQSGSYNPRLSRRVPIGRRLSLRCIFHFKQDKIYSYKICSYGRHLFPSFAILMAPPTFHVALCELKCAMQRFLADLNAKFVHVLIQKSIYRGLSSMEAQIPFSLLSFKVAELLFS